MGSRRHRSCVQGLSSKQLSFALHVTTGCAAAGAASAKSTTSPNPKARRPRPTSVGLVQVPAGRRGIGLDMCVIFHSEIRKDEDGRPEGGGLAGKREKIAAR